MPKIIADIPRFRTRKLCNTETDLMQVYKRFCFEFLSGYIALFYVAFWEVGEAIGGGD